MRNYWTGEEMDDLQQEIYESEWRDLVNTPRPTQEQREADLARIAAEERWFDEHYWED